MARQPSPQEIVALAGEGGGLTLYLLETDRGMRFSWNSIWQMPDESGQEPTKNPDWKAPEYLTVADAIAGVPAYWVYLAPLFVREDFQALFWEYASKQLAESAKSPRLIASSLARWKRACRRVTTDHPLDEEG
jgi:hypothetical protein